MSNTIKRRGFLQWISASTAIAAAGSPLAVLGSELEKSLPDTIAFLTKPYLQNPDPSAMTVCWLTNKKCVSWVELSVGDEPVVKVQHATDGLIAVNDSIQKIRLEHLLPGTVYRYQVFSKEILKFDPYKLVYGNTIASEKYQFTTPGMMAKEVSMIILNDIHDRPASFSHLMNMNGGHPYDLVFLNGDMFDFQKNEVQLVSNLLNPCGEIFSTIKPFLFIRGNHETRGSFARDIHSYFENIDDANYFAFTQGPVHFICLDTGEDKEDSHQEYGGLVNFDAYRERQSVWLEQQLKSRAYKKAKYKVVLMHIPHYHSGEAHGVLHCRKMFGDLFNQYKIDLLICGHTHVYGVHLPQEGHNFPIIIGGGPLVSKRTVMRLHADQKRLSVTMTRDDGVIVGEYSTSS